MSDSCSICGLILPSQASDYPSWCKDIRAVCWFEGHPILSGTGCNDEDAIPYLLPVPTPNRFYNRRIVDVEEGSCYPFHTTCWTILEDVAAKKRLVISIKTVFKIFESCHYNRGARALSWVHNYYLEDILYSRSSDDHQEFPIQDLIAAHKSNLAILADPSPVNFTEVIPPRKSPSIHFPHSASCRGLPSLPIEILHIIMYNLQFRDIVQLLQTCREYNTIFRHLPHMFWESRFHVYGETGFARSIVKLGTQNLPPKKRSQDHDRQIRMSDRLEDGSEYDSWQDWFLRIQSEIRNGPNRMNLRNRRRIWGLSIDLVELMQTVEDPSRLLHGDLGHQILTLRPCSTVSCLALKQDTRGCREMVQRVADWGESTVESQLCTVTPSYVLVSNRRLVSGITFTFSNSTSVNIGYIVGNQRSHLNSTFSPKFLWLVCSLLGIEAIAVDVYPQSFLDSSNGVAVSKWRLENMRTISLGLDSIRIVRICQDLREISSLDDALWTPPYPSAMPSMDNDDITALHSLQKESFAPASRLCIEPQNGCLVGIKVYAPLGWCTGITGVRFVYDTGIESLWGSDDDAASLSFFLDREEHLASVEVYKINSLVCHLQFTTDLCRVSGLLPPPSMKPISLECVDYRALDGGYIVGFCGCFINSSQQLHCFGVIPTTTVSSSKSTWSRALNYTSNISDSISQEMPQIKKHGEFKGRLLLERVPQSIQASISTVPTKYRPAGQVTGLLFRSRNNGSHPDLLGQWTGAGETYDLEENEWIIDLTVTMMKPRSRIFERPGLLQVERLSVFTNRRRMEWGSGPTQVYNISDTGHCKKRISEVTWDFNAIFDRLRWTYQIA